MIMSRFGDNIYIPMNERLVRYMDESSPDGISKLNNKLKIFTFIDSKSDCIECISSIEEISEWVTDNKLIETNSVNWLVTADMNTNLICRDIGMIASPTHLLCDTNGNIMDVIVGGVTRKWLDDHVLKYVKGDS